MGITTASWLVLSRQHASPPVARPHASRSPPRLLANLLLPQEESRNPIGTGPVPWLSVRSVGTRRAPSFSSASSPSSVLSVRSPRTSRLISVSSLLPSWPSKKLPRPTSLVSSRTPTSAPSTPSVSPSCPRTSSSHPLLQPPPTTRTNRPHQPQPPPH